jgi:hypothetical protein
MNWGANVGKLQAYCNFIDKIHHICPIKIRQYQYG